MEMSKIGAGIVQTKKWFSGRNSSVSFLPHDSISKSDMHIETSPWTAGMVCEWALLTTSYFLCSLMMSGLDFQNLSSGLMSAHEWVPFVSTFTNIPILSSHPGRTSCAGGETHFNKMQLDLSLPSFWHRHGNSHCGF